MTAPYFPIAADATRVRPPVGPMTIGPAPSVASKARPFQQRGGLLGMIERSAQPSPDTPLGLLNEVLNPVRAGAQARELVNQAVAQAQRGNVGNALMAGGLAAVAVPGVPGNPSVARMADDLIDVDGVLRPRLNSRGLPIHPTEEGIRNFWRWATDDGYSPVMDESGYPSWVYHGTRSDVPQFSSEMSRANTGAESSDLGFFTTDKVSGEPRGWMARGAEVWAADKGGSYMGGGNVMPLYARTRQSHNLTGREMSGAHFERQSADIRNAATERGEDSFVWRDGDETWRIFTEPTQLKSAIGNSGAFSRTDPRLTYGILGMLGLNAANRGEPNR